MMTKADNPIRENVNGLTKREHMIIEFTKALLSNNALCTPNSDFKAISESGILMADMLIIQLNREQ